MKTFLLFVITILLLTIVMANGWYQIWLEPFRYLMGFIRGFVV